MKIEPRWMGVKGGTVPHCRQSSLPPFSPPSVSRLDRYALSEVLVPFGFSLLATTLVVLLIQLQRLANAALGRGLEFTDILVLFGAALPPFFVLVIPIAFLLSVVMGLGRLSSDREMDALAASGAGPFRIARAPLLAGACVSLLSLPIAHFAEPYGLSMLYDRLVDVAMRNISAALRPGVFNEDFPGVALFAHDRRPSGELQDVLVYDQRDADRPVLLIAEAGLLAPVERPGKPPSLELRLERGELHLGATRTKDAYEVLRFDSAQIGIDPGRELRERTRFVNLVSRMSSGAMHKEAERRGPNDLHGRRIEKAYFRRFAFPLMALVFGFIGAAIVLTGRPDSRARNVVLALLAVVFYYVLVRVGDYWVVKGPNSAGLAAFGPNLALLVLGIAWLSRAGRAR